MNEDLFSFAKAILFLREWEAVCRKNWNGKDMFIYLVWANSYPAQSESAKNMIWDTIPYQEYIAFKTVDWTVVPWVASQTDILANDWEIL